MNADGSRERGITRVGCSRYGCALSWAPDGRKLVFAGEGGIYRVNADRRGLRLLTRHGSNPVWSPAGRKIAFDDYGGLYVVNSDGRGQRRLARRGGYPAWSADGTRIAFVILSGPRYGISVINVDGSGRRRLVALDAEGPVWSPTA
jgi:Tol biopolymer transport system component